MNAATKGEHHLSLDCPAKVNLALSLGSPDPARRNLHPIASWMTTVHLADHLSLRRIEGSTSQFELAFDTQVGQAVDWPLEKDLAFRAHALLQERCGRALPMAMRLHKRIPAGAGLGGGSSDAAAMLVGINRLFDLGITNRALIDLGLTLGSDVGFLTCAMLGRPAAFVGGFGERIEPLPLKDILPMVLIFPGFGCPTGEVYQAFDRRLAGAARVPREECVRELAASSPIPEHGPFNDLAEPACDVRPKLREIRELLREALRLPIHITGSGSTLYLIAPNTLTARALARKVTTVCGLPAIATRSA